MINVLFSIAIASIGVSLVQLLRPPRFFLDIRLLLILNGGMAAPVMRAIERGENVWFWVYLPPALIVLLGVPWISYRWRGRAVIVEPSTDGDPNTPSG